jgi:hypothetical protein
VHGTFLGQGRSRRAATTGRRKGEHVTTDIETTVPQALAATVDEKPPSVEHVVRANMVKAVGVSVPLAVVLFLGLVSLAVRNQDPDWPAYLSMAAGIGVLAGVFFGLLAGFMRSTHLFDN